MVFWTVLAVVVFGYFIFPFIFTRIMHKASFHKTGRTGTVSLTFDDGPHPEFTPRLLDVLNETDVRATFFVLADEAKRYPAIVNRMVREGHDVQVHGLKHWFVPILPPMATHAQCIGARRLLESFFGIRCMVYRPTWGACNLSTLWWMRTSGMKMCTWSVMVGDWRRIHPQELVSRIERQMCDEAIIVLHDSDKTAGAERGAPEAVIESMSTVVQTIKEQGFQFIRISDCL